MELRESGLKNPKPALLIIGGLEDKPPDSNPNVDRVPATPILSYPGYFPAEVAVPVPFPGGSFQRPALQSGKEHPMKRTPCQCPASPPSAAPKHRNGLLIRTAVQQEPALR
jgi:hypothetical protein